MAIHMMRHFHKFDVLPENVRVIRNYPGAEQGVSHSKRCVHYREGERRDPSMWELAPECLRMFATYEEQEAAGKKHSDYDWYSPCCDCSPIYLETTHVGVVLDLGEYNGRDDSDFYAVVWNDELGRTERIQYATTRGWCYPNNAEIDATPEVWAKFRAWQEECRRQYDEQQMLEAEARAAAFAAQTEELNRVYALKGSELTLGKGKKKFTGKLFWCGRAKTGFGVRCGVKDAAGKVKWVASTSVSATAV